MALDVESRATIDEAIDRAKAAGSQLTSDAAAQIKQSLLASIDGAYTAATRLLAAQDGWTLEIGPITIPAITIRLTKPK